MPLRINLPLPDWVPGDWWRWQVTPRDSGAYEATTVVARVDANGYEIGWGAVDEGLRSQFFHFIPHGDVSRDVVGPDDPELAAVLGLTLDGGIVSDARLLSVTEDGGAVRYAADGTAAPDLAVYLPVRADDFPPGSGAAFADIDMAGFREVVSAMIFLRYQLAEEDPEGLSTHHSEPLARGLLAYVEGS